MILTARDSVEDKVYALDEGADDYLVKPFSFAELLVRIRALLRRLEQVLPIELNIKDLALNSSTRQVTRLGREVTPLLWGIG